MGRETKHLLLNQLSKLNRSKSVETSQNQDGNASQNVIIRQSKCCFRTVPLIYPTKGQYVASYNSEVPENRIFLCRRTRTKTEFYHFGGLDLQYRKQEMEYPSRQMEKDSFYGESLKARKFARKTRNLLNLKK